MSRLLKILWFVSVTVLMVSSCVVLYQYAMSVEDAAQRIGAMFTVFLYGFATIAILGSIFWQQATYFAIGAFVILAIFTVLGLFGLAAAGTLNSGLLFQSFVSMAQMVVVPVGSLAFSRWEQEERFLSNAASGELLSND